MGFVSKRVLALVSFFIILLILIPVFLHSQQAPKSPPAPVKQSLVFPTLPAEQQPLTPNDINPTIQKLDTGIQKTFTRLDQDLGSLHELQSSLTNTQ